MCRWESGAAGQRGSFLRLHVIFRCALAALLPRCPAAPLGALTVLFFSIAPAHAQGTPDLEESRRRLEEIRAERDRLERQRERLQGQVHDVNDELSNLERQRESTQRIVGEIERQIGGLASQLDRSSAELILAQDNLAGGATSARPNSAAIPSLPRSVPASSRACSARPAAPSGGSASCRKMNP